MKLYNFWRSGTSHRTRIALNLKGISTEYLAVHLGKDAHLTTPSRPSTRSNWCRHWCWRPLTVWTGRNTPSSSPPPSSSGWRKPTPRLRCCPQTRSSAHRYGPWRRWWGVTCTPSTTSASWITCENSSVRTKRPSMHGAVRGSALGLMRWRHSSQQPASEVRYCFGNTPTLADVYLVPQIESARRFKVDLSRWPKLMAIDAHCATLKAFADAAPSRQPDAA
jgi:maleylpyruvate isomerase